MQKVIVLIFFMIIPANLPAQSFSTFVEKSSAEPDSADLHSLASFLSEPLPLIEGDTLVHWIYRGPAERVAVAGDANGWDPTTSPMQRLPGSDVWYFSRVFEADARLEYKLVIDGEWRLDPCNPRTTAGGFGINSELRMPEYFPSQFSRYDSTAPAGSLRDTLFTSRSDRIPPRTVKVYLPAEYPGLDSCAVLLVHDGLDYVNYAGLPVLLDNLIAQKRIVPIIAIFVPAVNRAAEYAGALKAEYTAFLVDEVMAWVDRRFRTCRSPGRRATLGASNGGNMALWLGVTQPRQFGLIAAQSSMLMPSGLSIYRRSTFPPGSI